MGETRGERARPALAITLFGPFEARLHGVPLPGLRARKGHWLLALLILRQGREVERGWLAGTLWPDSLEPQAFASLRNSLKEVRRELGEAAACLRSPTPRSLALDLAAIDVDVVAFDAAIERGDATSLETAVALYRGPLLEGCTEDWAFQEREVREQAYLGALERLAAEAAARADHAAAERFLRRAVGVVPSRETAQRALMRVLAASGNYSASTEVYRELRLHLHRDLNAEPDAETRALYQQIRAEARRRAHTPPPSPVPTPNTQHPTPLRLSHNLPATLTSFVGRKPQIAEIERLLAGARLLTLMGTGGCGKTRLALQVVTDRVAEFADGVWWVDLEALSDPELVGQTVASALEVREAGGEGRRQKAEGSKEPPESAPGEDPLTETLVGFLRSKHSLLVLDNCEHLLVACAQLAGRLLRACPDLRILTTSRERLGIVGEQVYRVPSLSLSDEAVQLFVERAALSQTTFAITDSNAAAVAQICRRLDGIPLAIELAAARLDLLSAEQIVAKLDDRFRLLTGGSRTALPRQRTLAALIDWSYDLLSEGARAMLRRFSVFVGGWTLEAAEAVCAECGMRNAECGIGATPASDPSDPSPFRIPHSAFRIEEVLDLLAQLVAKSLVVMEEKNGQARYRLFETIRHYARERLQTADEAEALRGRHRDWCLELAEDAEAELRGPAQGAWLERLETEHDNLRSALDGSMHAGDVEAALRLGTALWRFWHVRGYLREGRRRLEAALAMPGASPRMRARALNAAGALAHDQTDFQTAWALHKESLAVARACGDRESMATALNSLGNVALDRGHTDEATTCYQEALALWSELDDRQGIAMVRNNLGSVSEDRGDYEQAMAHYTESLAIKRQIGDERAIAGSLSNMGNVAVKRGDYARAAALLNESLRLFHRSGDSYGLSMARNNLADLVAQQGNLPRALALYRECLAACSQLENRQAMAEALEGVAGVLAEMGTALQAARLYGAAAALREAAGCPLPESKRSTYDGKLTSARAAADASAWQAAWMEGQALPLPQAIAAALSESE